MGFLRELFTRVIGRLLPYRHENSVMLYNQNHQLHDQFYALTEKTRLDIDAYLASEVKQIGRASYEGKLLIIKTFAGGLDPQTEPAAAAFFQTVTNHLAHFTQRVYGNIRFELPMESDKFKVWKKSLKTRSPSHPAVG